MVIREIILLATYIAGYLLAFAMIRVEHEAEEEVYTKGDRVLAFTLPILSWLTVLYMLTGAWISKIEKTGYWNKPVKEVKNEPAKVAEK